MPPRFSLGPLPFRFTPLGPIAAALAFGAVVPEGHAIMAGALPDTPVARVDANTATSPWRGVGSVVVRGSAYSGVLISPRHVLTAAHVVGDAGPAEVVFVLHPGSSAPLTLAAEAVTRFPDAAFPYDDLAVVQLQTPAPSGVPAYPIRAQPPAAAQSITLVGYGGSGNGDTGPSVGASSSVKRAGRNRIDAVVATLDESGRTSAFFVFDFDGPAGNGSTGGPTLGNAIESGLAGGDSGSPVFAEIDGVLWLVGISTFVAAPAAGQAIDYRFGSLGGGMLLSDARFQDWLRSTTGNSLVVPFPEGEVPAAPAWVLGLMGAALAGALSRRSRRGRAG